MKVSLRMPPTLKGEDASKVVIEKLTANPPFNANVQVEVLSFGNGLDAPKLPADI